MLGIALLEIELLSQHDYTGEAEKVMRQENRGVTLNSPHSDMKDACIKQY